MGRDHYDGIRLHFGNFPGSFPEGIDGPLNFLFLALPDLRYDYRGMGHDKGCCDRHDSTSVLSIVNEERQISNQPTAYLPFS